MLFTATSFLTLLMVASISPAVCVPVQLKRDPQNPRRQVAGPNIFTIGMSVPAEPNRASLQGSV
ncbi:hypothetical protein HYPSUDRAFT_43957 [Hypholoma sublateritium FD-334 SS-4]|uniref:Uncharacterized protein n=1 Tax=Hypholoma sublateritium (strain FD-334 SS-4) TaxID=945553 RepID=A0A0D2PIJ1_HYPSF|nr:hypothetical protein HYPSUDRAFT_43957 [Hypholoma sublateritium FD-334 SS-4]